MSQTDDSLITLRESEEPDTLRSKFTNPDIIAKLINYNEHENRGISSNKRHDFPINQRV